jgi:ribosomal protein S18 acetylase RimI-like enzyme
MSVEFGAELPTVTQFWDLFVETGWNQEYQLTPEDLFAAITHSAFTVTAYADGKLIGFGRVITDGKMHAMIYEVIVNSDFQRQGIGTRIVDMLVKKCLEANIHDIQLFSAPDKQSFYERLGFKVRPSNAPGMDYCRKFGGT